MVKPAKALTIKESVVAQLRHDIITGVMAPGTIIRDLELAERYQASTSPVREALQHLATEGLVEMPANRPKQIARLDRKLAMDLVAVHALLAMAAYEWGIPHIDAGGIRTMRHAMQLIKAGNEKSDQIVVLAGAREYNDVVLKATGNEPLRKAVISSFSAIERVVVLWSIKGFMHPEDLAQILDFVESGKHQLAIEHFRELLQRFQDDVASLSPYLR